MAQLTSWKQHSADLFRMYGDQGLISPSQFSMEGWNRFNYTLRSNGNEKGQRLRFTSIFTCPISGMQFPSGKMKSIKAAEKDGVYWYSKLNTMMLYLKDIVSRIGIFYILPRMFNT